MFGGVKHSAAENRRYALTLLRSMRDDGHKKAAVFIQNGDDGRLVRIQATEKEIQAACDAHSSDWKPDPELKAKWDKWDAKRVSYGIPDDYGHCLGAHSVLLTDRETGKPTLWGFWLSGLTTEETAQLKQYGKVVVIKIGKRVRQALATERVKNGVIVRTRVIKKVSLKKLRRW